MTHTQTVTILNGPPNCGKDTIAAAISEAGLCIHKEIKEGLYVEVAKYLTAKFNVTYIPEDIRAINADRKRKEMELIGGKTCREWMIYVSEEIIKPTTSNGHFGHVAATAWKGYCAPIIVSDGGFHDEIKSICNIFGDDNVLVIQLHREDCNFIGDSRDYIDPNKVTCKVRIVDLAYGNIQGAIDDVTYLIRRNLPR